MKKKLAIVALSVYAGAVTFVLIKNNYDINKLGKAYSHVIYHLHQDKVDAKFNAMWDRNGLEDLGEGIA